MYSAGFSCPLIRSLALGLVVFFLPAALVAQERTVVHKLETHPLAEQGLGLRPLWPPLHLAASKPMHTAGRNRVDQQNPQGRTRYTQAEEESRKGLYVGASLAVVGGVLAWWSKQKADTAYDTYLRSASRKRQEDQMDRAERFDRLAGGAFALMEAGVVLSVYFTFLDNR